MVTTIEATVSLRKTLFDQADILAQQLNMSRSQFFETAIETFIRDSHNQTLLDDIKQPNQDQPAPIDSGQLIVNQGDLYWVQFANPTGLEPGIPHPHVVIQENVLNHSRIHTVVACALTTNMKRANLPGNVLLEAGEANLAKQSIVEPSKVSTIEKTQLGAYIGSLTEKRINEILAGMRFLQTSFFAR
jgi:mRNA interferase MazF